MTVATLQRTETLTFGPGCKATRTSLTIADSNLDVTDWEQLLARVVAFSDSSAWWIGDVLAYGEWRYGEKYRAVLAELEVEYDRARDYAYVAGNVPGPVRQQELSFRHHRVVAKLAPADQERWLKRAVEEKWSYRELERQIDEADSGGIAPSPHPLEQLRFTVAPDRLERWQVAAERAHAASVAEWALDVLDQAAGVE